MKKTVILVILLIAMSAPNNADAIPTLQVGAPGLPDEGFYADYQDQLANPEEQDTAVTNGSTLLLAGNYGNDAGQNPTLLIGGQYSATTKGWASFDTDEDVAFYSNFAGHGAVLMATVADNTLGSFNSTDFMVSVDGSAYQSAFYTRSEYDFGKLLPNETQEHAPIKNQDYLFFDVGNFSASYMENFPNFADESETASLYGQIKDITLALQGIDWVHFDLLAIVTDVKGQCRLISSLEGNPNSKDVTWKSTPVPEPVSMLLFGTGLAGLFGLGQRRKR